MILPTEAKARKDIPLARGVLDYFPDALCEVAEVSRIGNEQHNPGQPLHWAKEKSTDEADALVRHLLERGKRDSDGVRHSAKVAWRALANLQREIDAERAAAAKPVPGLDALKELQDLQRPKPLPPPPSFREREGWIPLSERYTLDVGAGFKPLTKEGAPVLVGSRAGHAGSGSCDLCDPDHP